MRADSTELFYKMVEEKFINVSPIHRIYSKRMGNILGQDIIFIHGGPGIGINERDKQFFDFDKVNVVYYDQRGCGFSTPLGELEENTTQELINDIDKIISAYNLQNPVLFGGSWGSCLSLLYAIQNPTNVKCLILRGLFMASKNEREYFEKFGVQNEFPVHWNRLKSYVETDNDFEVMNEYFDRILHDRKNQYKLSFEFKLYKSSMGKSIKEIEEVRERLMNEDHFTNSTILSHFAINNFFMEENEIEDQLEKLKELPIKIIHGRNDWVTNIGFPRVLSKKYENIELLETNDGHSPYENENLLALKQEMAKFN